LARCTLTVQAAASRVLLARRAVRRCTGVRPLEDRADDSAGVGGVRRDGIRRGVVDATPTGPDGIAAAGAVAARSSKCIALVCHAGTGAAPRHAGVGTGGGSGSGGRLAAAKLAAANAASCDHAALAETAVHLPEAERAWLASHPVCPGLPVVTSGREPLYPFAARHGGNRSGAHIPPDPLAGRPCEAR